MTKRAVYDKFADRYDRIFSRLEKSFLAKWREEVLIYLQNDSRILEIGAGTGLNFRFYPAEGKVLASDISIEMLKLAGQKKESELTEIIQADAENLPIADSLFDSAFATLVFCSIPDPQKAFRELQRVVKNGGRVVLLEHVRPRGGLGFVFDLLNIFTVALIDDHFNRQTAKLAKESGLKIVEVKQKSLGIVNLIVCEVVK